MIEEQMTDASVEELTIPTVTTIFKTRTSASHKDTIKRVFDKADTSFNDGKTKDNLIKTDRTGWLVHEDYPEDIHPVLNDLCDKFHRGLKQRTFDGADFSLDVQLRDSWIARSKAGAVVDPHHHGLLPTWWSFCYYAEIPSRASSITFMDNSVSSKVVVNVQEGDVIWFPSSLTHYTVDTEEGRLIYSGNVSVVLDGQMGQQVQS